MRSRRYPPTRSRISGTSSPRARRCQAPRRIWKRSPPPRKRTAPPSGNETKAMSAVLLAQQILNGLLDGVYYLLIALGLSLIFSLGGIVNLAHGAFYAIGAYLTLVISPYLGFGGAFVAAPVAVALLGVVIERTLFRRFYRSDPILSLLLTFGLAMVAEQVLRMIFGAPPLSCV